MGSNQAWLDGSYKVLFGDKVYAIASVKGENVWLDQLDDDAENEKKRRIWKAGAFEKTNEDILAKTGAANYNFQMIDPSNSDPNVPGVVSEDGKIITCRNEYGTVYTMEWIDQAEAENIKTKAQNDMDSAEAPPSHYPIRPTEAGKLVWVSGAPGFGKSTTARRMGEKEGFVYYEGDCFMSHTNPYLPPADNTAIDALMDARKLRGVPKERKEIVRDSMKEWKKLMNGDADYDLGPFYSSMCDNITQERKRIGGDWVVAQAVPSRKMRDLIKSKLGPDVQFMVLNLDSDYQLERLQPRTVKFGKEIAEAWVKMKYEPAEEDEENAFDLKIIREMSLDDVVQQIKSRLN